MLKLSIVYLCVISAFIANIMCELYGGQHHHYDTGYGGSGHELVINHQHHGGYGQQHHGYKLYDHSNHGYGYGGHGYGDHSYGGHSYGGHGYGNHGYSYESPIYKGNEYKSHGSSRRYQIRHKPQYTTGYGEPHGYGYNGGHY